MSFKRTLRTETEEYLARHGKTLDDVNRIIVQVEEYERRYVEITVEKFISLSNFYYDSGYGARKVMPMWMHGDGFMIYREEYDGAEGWAYIPMVPNCEEDIKTLSINEYDRAKFEEQEAEAIRRELE